jgi:hypothetical protein
MTTRSLHTAERVQLSRGPLSPHKLRKIDEYWGSGVFERHILRVLAAR